eukprot:TRINITY_DN43114_c0_g1_i1.p1 TRINITY_DN43114_c0_g1~~TRINITY_DN43114_c0_g1_i1.p1  ORF type:complete len:553 (+),score=84.31 TRINITY_DN43114_c0_g1_i1:85-1743(+)
MAARCPNGHDLVPLQRRPAEYHGDYIIRCDSCSAVLTEDVIAAKPGLYCPKSCGFDLCHACSCDAAVQHGEQSEFYDIRDGKVKAHAEKKAEEKAREAATKASWKHVGQMQKKITSGIRDMRLDPTPTQARLEEGQKWCGKHLQRMEDLLFEKPGGRLREAGSFVAPVPRNVHPQELLDNDGNKKPISVTGARSLYEELAKSRPDSAQRRASPSPPEASGNRKGSSSRDRGEVPSSPLYERRQKAVTADLGRGLAAPPVEWRQRILAGRHPTQEYSQAAGGSSSSSCSSSAGQLGGHGRSRQRNITALRMIERRATADFFNGEVMTDEERAKHSARMLMRMLREPTQSQTDLAQRTEKAKADMELAQAASAQAALLAAMDASQPPSIASKPPTSVDAATGPTLLQSKDSDDPFLELTKHTEERDAAALASRTGTAPKRPGSALGNGRRPVSASSSRGRVARPGSAACGRSALPGTCLSARDHRPPGALVAPSGASCPAKTPAVAAQVSLNRPPTAGRDRVLQPRPPLSARPLSSCGQRPALQRPGTANSARS